MISKETFIHLIQACEKEYKFIDSLCDLLGVNAESNLYNFLDTVVDEIGAEVGQTALIYDYLYSRDSFEPGEPVCELPCFPENAGELYEAIKFLNDKKLISR